jgi:hypothetical protein
LNWLDLNQLGVATMQLGLLPPHLAPKTASGELTRPDKVAAARQATQPTSSTLTPRLCPPVHNYNYANMASALEPALKSPSSVSRKAKLICRTMERKAK